MKKLWLLGILFLTTVSTATQQTTGFIQFQGPIVLQPIIEEEYYPIYDSGVVVDSSTVEFLQDSIKVASDVYPMLKIMLDSAMSDSVILQLNSGYRTFEEQYKYRAKFVKREKHRNDSSFLLNAEARHFRPHTAKPGHSSHQGGIAFDFKSTNEKHIRMWLKENAIKYGFVRTVPSERWHYEYLPHIKDQYFFVSQKHRSWS